MLVHLVTASGAAQFAIDDRDVSGSHRLTRTKHHEAGRMSTLKDWLTVLKFYCTKTLIAEFKSTIVQTGKIYIVTSL